MSDVTRAGKACDRSAYGACQQGPQRPMTKHFSAESAPHTCRFGNGKPHCGAWYGRFASGDVSAVV